MGDARRSSDGPPNVVPLQQRKGAD
jgi:hypothetical protein